MQIETKERIIGRGNTVISPSPKKEREMLDKEGNIIDPRTKQIIKRVNE